MSNAHLFIQSGFPRAALTNGLGRYICQLQRVTIKFCKSNGGSRGVREFIENDLVDFARENPNVVVYVKPRRHKSPVFVAEYLNGERKWMAINNFTREEVLRWLNLFKNQSGQPELKFKKHWHTDNPSIQGPWNPFLFRDPDFNGATFPQEKFSIPKNLAPTATEILLEMYKKQNSEGVDSKESEKEIKVQS